MFYFQGIKKADGTSSKDFKTTKSKNQIISAFTDFTGGSYHVLVRSFGFNFHYLKFIGYFLLQPKYIQRLKAIRATLECSDFFRSHEVIGSSLLFVHDETQASVWLIDFAKTVILPEKIKIDHNSKWTVGNHEDGYLIGINNIIDFFTELLEKNTFSLSERIPSLSLSTDDNYESSCNFINNNTNEFDKSSENTYNNNICLSNHK